MIAVDTSVWIDWINRKESEQVQRLSGVLNQEEVVVGDIVLLEVLQGARDDLQARRIEKILDDCVHLPMLSKSVAIAAASNFRTLRRHGITVRKTPNLIIGTWCIENNVPLLHSDRDFKPMVDHLGLIEY
jgi:predicted nucleic acid-binding protein